MGLEIDINWDSSVDSAPAAFKTGVMTAVQYLESVFTNPITITINVGYGEVDEQTLDASALGESVAEDFTGNFSYSQIRNALIAENAPGSSTLPATSPLSGSIVITTAEAKALGLSSYTGTDGWVGFDSNPGAFSYGDGTTPPANEYYFIGTVEHEITEDMGRVSDINAQSRHYSPMDLYRYSAPGVRDLRTGGAGSTAYFSINNGTTNLGTWNNQTSNGDLGDWYPAGPAPGGDNSFNDYSNLGVVNVVSQDDLTLMEALGYTPASLAALSTVAVSAGQTYTVSSGQVANNDTVLAGGSMLVYGTANNTTDINGGEDFVEPGGTASGTVLNYGYEFVWGGTTSDTTISAGAQYEVAGSTITNTTVAAGGLVGNSAVLIYGIANGTTDTGGGEDFVEPGGTASGTVLNYGYEFVWGGTASGTTISAGAQYEVAGSTITNTTVAAGGLVGNSAVLIYGIANGTTDTGGGEDFVEPGGTASGTVLDYGYEFVWGGTASGTTISAGAQYEEAGSLAKNTLIESGGAQLVYGIVTATTVAGGTQQVFSGGSISGTTIEAGTVVLSAGAIVNGAITFAGGGTLFDADQAAHADTVMGFREGTDFLSFTGENASTENSVVAAAQTSGGNTTLTFPDQTSIVLVGVTHVDTGIFA